MALIAYSSEKKLGFLSHLDRQQSVNEAFGLISANLGDDSVLVIYGGNGEAGKVTHVSGSRQILSEIFKRIGDYKVVGKELLGNQSRAIAIDTENGQVFIPRTIMVADDSLNTDIRYRSLTDDPRLSNDGKPVFEIRRILNS